MSMLGGAWYSIYSMAVFWARCIDFPVEILLLMVYYLFSSLLCLTDWMEGDPLILRKMSQFSALLQNPWRTIKMHVLVKTWGCVDTDILLAIFSGAILFRHLGILPGQHSSFLWVGLSLTVWGNFLTMLTVLLLCGVSSHFFLFSLVYMGTCPFPSLTVTFPLPACNIIKKQKVCFCCGESLYIVCGLQQALGAGGVLYCVLY